MFINYNGVFGLSGSGFDVEGTVEKLMQTERSKYDKMYQKREKLTWQKDGYREMNTAISAFRNKVFDMKLKANMDLKKATSSNESAVTVTANSGSVNGTNSIEVSQLAEGASAGSTNPVVGLVDGKFDFGGVESKEFTINGKTITVKNGDTAASLVNKVNSSDLGVKASYDSTLNRFFLSTSKTGQNSVIELEDTDGFLQDNLQLSGLTGSAVTSATLDDIKNYLTSDNKFDFGANVDADGNHEFIINGKSVKLKQDATLDDLNKALKAADAGVAIRGDKNGLRAATSITGKDAKFELNGIALTQETNKFTINGLTYNLKAQTTGKVTISTTVDTDKIYEQIKGFMDAYNDLINTVNTKINEKTYRDYPPLTEQQKEDDEMSEEQIKAWNKKAQSGMLKGDSTLSSLLSSMRLELSNPLKLISSNNDMVVTANATSKAQAGKNTVNVTQMATGAEVTAKTKFTVTDGKIDLGPGVELRKFTINGKEVRVKKGDTVDDFNKAMAATGVTITASGDKITFTAQETGTSSKLKFEGDLTGVLEIDESTRRAGIDAKFAIKDKDGKFLDKNGNPTDTDPGLTSETNAMEIGGIKYTFQGVGETTVTVSNSQLNDFGIETGAYDTHGKLVFSDATGDKLKAAIEANPDAVINFFTKQSKVDNAEKGLAQRLQESLDKTMKLMKDKAGLTETYADQSLLGKQIGDLDTDLKDELKRLKVVEQNYYSEYSKMEVYINQMLQQSSMFSSYAG